MEVTVSVLVPVLNEEQHVREAVETMRAQTLGDAVELIFVDGRSEDRTREILEELAREDERVRVLDGAVRSTPAQLNQGLRAARGEFVARMDAHTHYPPDYLERAVARLRRGDVEHVSGPQVAVGRGRWSRRTALALATPLGVGGASFRSGGSEEIEVDTGFTGVWARSTLERHAGWDEGWPQNQDSELAARIRAEGGRLVCLPELAADYIPRDSLRALARQYYRYGTYRAKTALRHPHSMRRSHVLPPALTVALLLAPVLPRPLRRLVLGSYAAALGAGAASAAGRASLSDAAWMPLVLAVMHVCWGLGFLRGCMRFGPPLEALARVAGLRGGGN
jgi:glycosyltransferase involved in cell wall biosynthesis